MSTERELISEVEELLAKATPGRLTLIRYEHGGGRLYREEPRELVADFYNEGDRELYSRSHELLHRLVEEVKRTRQFGCEHCNCPCTNCGPCGDNHA